MRKILPVIGIVLLAGPKAAPAGNEPPALSYERDVKPLIAKYCISCHRPPKPKGGVDLASFASAAAALKDHRTWDEVRHQLETREMPPSHKTQPTAAERERLLAWTRQVGDAFIKSLPKDPGRVTYRRLNRTEYANTVRELLQIRFTAAKDLPSDTMSAEGFDNNADVLTLSPLLMEKYFDLAEKALDEAIVSEGIFRPVKLLLEPKKRFTATGSITVPVELPLKGRYKVTVKSWATRAGSNEAWLGVGVTLDGKQLKKLKATGSEKRPRDVRFTISAEAGRPSLTIDAVMLHNQKIPAEKRRKHQVAVESILVEGPLYKRPPKLPASHTRLFVAYPDGKITDREAARTIVTRFARLAFRRPIGDPEAEGLTKLFDAARARGLNFEASVRTALLGVLISPHFLFRIEAERKSEGAYRISDWELASRLSYFLWATMPDEELLGLAEKHTLHEPAVLEKQVRRMLADPKARALAEEFAGKWLQLPAFQAAEPDPKIFPKFTRSLRRAMSEETILFFQEIMKKDRSILELVDADYTFLNEELAKHYGIAGVRGSNMRRVNLTDRRRGGVLTMGSVLTLTSYPYRTSVTIRGKWILERILGTPPPPPPPNAATLDEDSSDARTLTLKERMERHRKDPNCAACHRRMDPIGLGFENFDAIGRWRTADKGKAIDPKGDLPSGEAFKGPEDLKRLLAGRRKDLATNITEKMMMFALGRSVVDRDTPAVRAILESLERNDHRFGTLVLEIVKSYPFQYRRGPENQKPAGGAK